MATGIAYCRAPHNKDLNVIYSWYAKEFGLESVHDYFHTGAKPRRGPGTPNPIPLKKLLGIKRVNTKHALQTVMSRANEVNSENLQDPQTKILSMPMLSPVKVTLSDIQLMLIQSSQQCLHMTKHRVI